ncbi:MAG: hypothetical protein V4548_10410 [Bacteroidota bacterium]
MGNITENKLNAIILAADITAINTTITTIASKLPVGSLTDEQRTALKSIDVSNKIFVEDVLIELTASGTGIIPTFINQAFIQNDLSLYEQLDTIEASLLNVQQRITDLKRISGDEAYTAALAVYRIFDGANQAGVPNAKQAYERLKARFDAQGSTGRPAAPSI